MWCCCFCAMRPLSFRFEVRPPGVPQDLGGQDGAGGKETPRPSHGPPRSPPQFHDNEKIRLGQRRYPHLLWGAWIRPSGGEPPAPRSSPPHSPPQCHDNAKMRPSGQGQGGPSLGTRVGAARRDRSRDEVCCVWRYPRPNMGAWMGTRHCSVGGRSDKLQTYRATNENE